MPRLIWICSLAARSAAVGCLLFSLAGTLNWWRAWLFLGLAFLCSTLTLFALYPSHKGILEERFKPVFQEGQPLADKLLLAFFFLMLAGMMVMIPLDRFHFHVLPRPGPIVTSFGLLLYLAGSWIVYLVFRENRFAAPVVKHQQEREHVLVDTGVYSIVRHPMYAGAVLLFIGMPLWLESYAAALVSCAALGVLVIRIMLEERFLSEKLEGYEAYACRVPWRLLPHVW